jgi:hypothetical protein
MTMDRRGFLYAGGLTAAAGALVTSAHAAPSHGGKSVEELGVVPNLGLDQTEALQKAIDTISMGQQAVILPGGTFQARKLKIAANCTLIGQPGKTDLNVEEFAVDGGATYISGVSFKGEAKGKGALVVIDSGIVNISRCSFSGGAGSGTGLKVKGTVANLNEISIEGFGEAGAVIDLEADGGIGLHVSHSHFMNCGTGIVASMSPMTISQCHFVKCGTGIAATGSGLVTGNTITTASSFGIKLGSAKGSGHIMAQGNLIRGARIAIGVSASGDDIMASLNMITGAKDGAIRAFDGEKLVGPDLARQSAEAYLNLMVAGNVVR